MDMVDRVVRHATMWEPWTGRPCHETIAMPKPRNILVFLPNWVGDVMMATPMLRALRQGVSGARIVYVGRPVALAVLEGCTWCDEVIRDDSQRRPRLINTWRTRRRLRKAHADLAVLLPNSFRSAMLARFAGATRRVGYARDGRGWLLTDRLHPPRDEAGRFRPTPMIDYYAALLTPIGITLSSRAMELPLAPAERARAEAVLTEAGFDPDRPLVMLNPGASFGTSKLWPAERYAEAADTLIETRDAQVILNAAPNPTEQALADTVARAMRGEPLLNFAHRPNTLGLLKGLLRRCDLLITNDTGARHIAAALGAGVVTIFGSTDPVWAQIDSPRERIVRIDVPCGPCQKKTCPFPPGPEHLQCLTSVGVDRVLSAAEELLAERQGGERE